jgi:hypothetical protein
MQHNVYTIMRQLICYGPVWDGGIRCNPALPSQSGVLERKNFMKNRNPFPACNYYRIIGVGALGDIDMV